VSGRIERSTHLSVSAVVCAYTDERWEQLERAVDSLLVQSTRPLEIIVVIDHNRALQRRAAERWPGCIVVRNRYAQGLSGARNTGVEVARGEVVAFLDDDAAVPSTWVEQLTGHLADDEVVGVGSRVDPEWSDARPAWFPAEFDWVVGCSYTGLPSSTSVVRNPIGAAMMFRRRAVIEAGGFRSEVGRVGAVGTGCEETELAIRLRAAGGAILYDPSVAARHVVTPQRATHRYFTSRCWHEGLSTAAVRRFVGATDALESERTYVRRTLTRGIARSVAEVVVPRRHRGAASRAGAIVIGLTVTSVAYAWGVASSPFAARTSAEPRRRIGPGSTQTAAADVERAAKRRVLRPELIGDLAVAVVAFATALFVIADADVAVRPVVALVFFLVCPGWVTMRLFGAPARAPTALMAVGLSVASTILLAEALALTGWTWRPASVVFCLATATAAVAQTRRHSRA
jgi:hypothetical protein